MFASIYLHWKKYQTGLVEEIKRHGQLVIAGDGRHDSMGHSAKYCAYTVFCCTLPLIFYFTLVQVQYMHYLFRFKWKIHVRCLAQSLKYPFHMRSKTVRVFYNYVYDLQRTQVNNFPDIRTNSNCVPIQGIPQNRNHYITSQDTL